MNTLANGAIKQTVIATITNKMKILKAEIEAFKNTKPPKDHTTDYITKWLDSLKENLDKKAIHLLIERINVKSTTDIRIINTLTSVVGEIGCGGLHHSLPTILFYYIAKI